MVEPAPRRSTLFPYTTLFRSFSVYARLKPDVTFAQARAEMDRIGKDLEAQYPQLSRGHGAHRSEEHTSELQSRLHLVCRLPLENKKSVRYESRVIRTTLECFD